MYMLSTETKVAMLYWVTYPAKDDPDERNKLKSCLDL